MMEYKEFEKTLVHLVQNKFGGEYRVEVHQVAKNNGVLLNGMVIMSRDKNISPTIYLEPYFEQYQDGMGLDEILEDICGLYESSQENVLSWFGDLKNFEVLKDKVVYKLIGRDKNGQLLKDVPFTPLLDLAIVYYLLVESDESGQMTALIHNEHLKLWKVEQEELHRLATENTQRLLPVCIRPIKDIMFDIMANNVENFDEAETICGFLEEDEKEMGHPLFVLSNTTGMNGAACMLYDCVVEQFAREHESDVIILPSSIHELLLLSWSEEMDYEDLQQMVQNVNETMMQSQDILSDHVYVYIRDEGVIRMAI